VASHRCQIAEEYPGITTEDVAACLAYASEVIKSEKVYPARAVLPTNRPTPEKVNNVSPGTVNTPEIVTPELGVGRARGQREGQATTDRNRDQRHPRVHFNSQHDR